MIWYTYQVADGTRLIRERGDDRLVASIMPTAYDVTADRDAAMIAVTPELLNFVEACAHEPVLRFDEFQRRFGFCKSNMAGKALELLGKAGKP